MHGVIEWDEWVRRVRQEIDQMEDMGRPLTVSAESDPLTPDLLVDTLADLESRGTHTDALVAVLSPIQMAGLLNRTNALKRVPKEQVEENETPLPENTTIYGVPLRVEVGFPERVVCLFPPDHVTLTGQARIPSTVGVVDGLSLPEFDEDADVTPGEVREARLSAVERGGSTGEDDEDDSDDGPDRRGQRFVSDGGYTPPGEEPWVVTLGEDPEEDAMVVVALTEETGLAEIDALEHRFSLVDDPEKDPNAPGGVSAVAVYSGVMLHRCHDEEDGHDSTAECELYVPEDHDVGENVDPVGTASLSDLPQDVQERVSDLLDVDVLEPSEVEGDPDPLSPADMGFPGGPPETEPRGFQ